MTAPQRFAAMRDLYVEQHEAVSAEARRREVDTQLRRLAKLVPIGSGTSLLELAELARRDASAAGVSVDVRVGLAESYPFEA